MIDGDTDAVLDLMQREGCIFYFRRSHLIASHINDISLATFQAQHALLVDMAHIGCKDRIIVQDGGSKFRIIHIARHQRITLTGNQTVGSDQQS